MNTKFCRTIIIMLNVFAFILGYLFIFSYLNGDICTDHDHFYPLEVLKQKIFFQEGRWISSIFTYTYFILIPKLFNVHINDLTTTLIPFVNASAISISSIFCLRLFFFFDKNKQFLFTRPAFFLLYPGVFLTMAILPLINGGNMDVFFYSSLHSVIRHYDHYFCYVFYVVFCYGVISSFYEERTKKITSLFYFANAFLLGVSTESLPIMASVTVVAALMYAIFCSVKNKKQINEGTIFFLVHIFLFLEAGAFLQFFFSSYRNGVDPGYFQSVFKDVSSLEVLVIPYLKTFKNVVFADNAILWLILLVINAVIWFTKNDKSSKFKIYILQFLIMAGFLFESVFLFFLGDASNIYPISFWIEYYPFRTMMVKTIFLLIFISGGYALASLPTKKKQICVYLLAIASISYMIASNFQEIIREYNLQVNEIKDLRPSIYKADKMALTYYALDGIAILPISFYEKYSQHTSIFRPRCLDSHEDIRNMAKALSKKEVQKGETRVFTHLKDDDDSADIDYLYYLELAYGIKLDGVKFVDDKLAYEEFAKRKGTFEDKEMKKLSFTHLKRNLKTQKALVQNSVDEKSSYMYVEKCRYNLTNADYDAAIQNCTNAINLGIKNNEKFYNLYYAYRAEAYNKKGDIDSAIKDYEILMQKEYFYPKAMQILADLYEEKGGYDKSIKLYERIESIFPFVADSGTARTYYNKLADLAYKKQDYKGVINYVNEAEKYNENEANYMLRASANRKLGNITAAKNDLELAKEFYPEKSEEIQNILDEINKKSGS